MQFLFSLFLVFTCFRLPRVLAVAHGLCTLWHSGFLHVVCGLSCPLAWGILYPGKVKVSHTVMSESPTPWTSACPAPLCHGILQARVLGWVAISFSRGSSQLGIEPGSPALEADSLPTEPPGKPLVPGPGIKPMSPDFEGWFLTTGPPRKSLHCYFYSFFIDEETESEVWREHSREIQVRPCLSKYHVCLQESSVSAASSHVPSNHVP